ncbi:RagB/SusD family nutrient uptake outer membrane protein [Flavobacterium sp.]|uniref:RagB/SusD family nutrient uptake outer membrane protein n=1 Tax=Flavobacterium sp. TaxID=239 RepID=UPI0035AFECF6
MKKIKSINFKLFVFFGLVAFFMSCTNDMNVTPKDDDDFTSEAFYSNPSSYKQFLAKIYAGLAVTGQNGPDGSADIQGIDEGFGQYLRGYWQLQELPTDEAMVSWGDPTLPELNNHTWNADNRFVKAFYARVFYQVGLANEFLRATTDEKLASRGVSDALKAEIKVFRAEVRFLRALSYYHGIDLFGKVAFATENDLVGTKPVEKDRTYVFNYLVSELNAIDADLKDARTNEYGRVDKVAAKMLLAKLYLNAKVYTGASKDAEALAAINSVIGSSYSIANVPYSNLFMADNDRTAVRAEIIFPIRFNGVNTKTWGGTTFIIHASTGGWNSDMGIDGGWYGLAARKEFANLFSDLSGATDRRAMFDAASTSSLTINSVSDFFGNGGLKVKKYSNKTSAGANGSNLTHTDTDFPLFRLADAYLMYAELAANNVASASKSVARGYVNTLRTRAGAPLIANDSDITPDFILDERARELYWEGHRRQDLIRANKFTGSAKLWQWKGNALNGASIDSKFNVYPIPQTELNTNSNLTQNTGY